MASGSEALKKNKSSANESVYNKTFNSKRNNKNNSNENAMEESINNSKGFHNKGQNGQDKSLSTSLSSDEDRCWKFRPPPRGFTSESYALCQNFTESVCSFGSNCVEAHGEAELQEWKDRFEIRKVKLEKSLKTQYGKSYLEELLERLNESTNPEKIMRNKLDCVEVTCSNELNLTVSSKTCKREWIFVLKTKNLLKAVALLQDEHRTHFSIKHVYPMSPGKQSSNQAESSKPQINNQEWQASVESQPFEPNEALVSHRVKISFSTDIYGTFRQAVCFEFVGLDVILVKHFCIDVVPLEEYDKIQEIKNDILTVTRTRWNPTNADVIPFKAVQAFSVHNETAAEDLEKETELLELYPCPQADTFVLSHSTISGKLSEINYQQWMHTLLYIEEMARFDLIAKFNLTTDLKITNNFILAPNGMATSTAKYSHSGELFGVLELAQNISEETPSGYLILNNCNSLYLCQHSQKAVERPEVFEVLIEDKSKNIIYLKLSADTVKALGAKHEEEVKVDIQFQPNRLTYCEWHMAVDRIPDYKFLFPDTQPVPDISWNPKRQWDSQLDQKLNSKQREAVLTITSPITTPMPPILLIGPFGTGKTYTLAQIIKQLLTQKESRILICTHSNSAADLYIREYLHPWVESGIEEAKPLRIYYHKRWVATVNQVVQKYCMIELKGQTRVFKKPTVEDVEAHKIVVVTLSTSNELASLNLKKGYFTHILLDEAAQALESEAITPLALADQYTRIVLAGDHMQMSPEIFSNFARERKLHVSLLERLYDHYPASFPTKILLCENYRAHDAIIKFTSELFYDQKLIASGKQPRHEKFYPLTFFTTRGEDIQDKNSTAFYNNAEVYEIVERVCELRRKWPSSWGKFSDTSIGIMTPYADQVFRIRSELRKKRMAGISVERVLNVQGKQFRAVFLSTVRTRKTCTNKAEDIDYGFLSNSKLLNTAITRAQSLVSVVGDPVALCSVGRCRKVWERFLEICHQNKSLFGITWQSLKSQLDGVELRKTYVLNPLAPEFIPRVQTEVYLRDQVVRNNRNFNQMIMPQGPMIPHAMNHPMNFHNNQQIMGHQHPFHPPMPPNQQSQMMGPNNNPFPPGIKTSPQGFNNNNMMNQQMRSFGNSSYQPIGPGPGPVHAPPPNNMQHFPPFNSGSGPYPNPQNFNQPNTLAQPHGSMLQNFSMGQHINTNNLWNSPNSLFHSGPEKNAAPTLQTGNPWHSKSPAMQQHSPHQVRPAVPVMRSPQASQMFTPPLPQQSQYHGQHQSQQLMNSFQSLPKFPNNDTNVSFNGNQPGMDLNVLSNHTSKLTINEMMSQPDFMDMKKSEKDVLFLQNVHFPEKQQQLLAMAQAKAAPQASKFPLMNLQSMNYNHLLPPNMSFYDVVSQSKEFQFRWFHKLAETYGLEEADKFTEILRQIPMMMNNNSKPNPSLFEGNQQNHSNHESNHQMMNHEMGSMAQKLFQNNELDSVFMNSLRNQKVMSDQFGAAAKERESIFQQLPAAGPSSNYSDPLERMDLFGMPTKAVKVDNEEQNHQRSVPLYMRKKQNENFA